MSILMIALETTSSASPAKWIVGGCTLAILLLVLFAMLAFGKGREHS